MAKYHILSEILETPVALDRTAKAFSKRSKFYRIFERCLKQKKRVFLVGSGSSYNACLFGSQILMQRCGVLPDVVLASEFCKFNKNMFRNDLVILVSQSGQSGDILNSLKTAKASGAVCLAITNGLSSDLTKGADATLNISVGRTVAVAATKTVAGTMQAFLILAENYIDNSDFDSRESGNAVADGLKTDKQEIDGFAKNLLDDGQLYILGEGTDFALAREFGLKLSEAAGIANAVFETLEFRHGPIVMVKKGTKVLIVNSQHYYFEEMKPVFLEIQKRGGEISAISTLKSDIFSKFVVVSDRGIYSAFSALTIMQLVAYEAAIFKKMNPDKPEGLLMVVK